MSRLLVERWTSDDAKEVHYFLEGDQRGYAYVLGVNPDLFTPEMVATILAMVGLEAK